MVETSLFPDFPAPASIKWRRAGEGTFFFVESLDPATFRIDCVTSDGQRANLMPVTVRDRTYPAGCFFRAMTRKEGGEAIYSDLCDSLDAAKEACEHCHREGDFPKKKAGLN